MFAWLKAQQQRSAEGRAKLATLGLAAVLAYGEGFRCCLSCCSLRSPWALPTWQQRRSRDSRWTDFGWSRSTWLPNAGLFDGVSYTIAFALAFLGYEAQTGLNPTQNVSDIVKICILM